MTDQPLVSVIVPVYNPGKYLYACLDSLTNQTWQNLEIILIDDGSSDGSLDVCRLFAERDSRIIVLHQENKGVSSARNSGLSIAKGDYYSFIDSDDYLERDCYEYLLKTLKKNDAEAITFEYFITKTKDEKQHIYPLDYYGNFDRHQTLYRQLIKGVPFLCTKLLPQKAVNGLRFHEDIYRGEDSLFATQALSRMDRVCYDSRPLLHYVQSEESACRGSFRPTQLTATQLYPIIREYLLREFPDLYISWLCNFQNILISLYCDMYFDKIDYTTEMNDLHLKFRNIFIKTFFSYASPIRQKSKLLFFRLFPTIFCKFHKLIHNL